MIFIVHILQVLPSPSLLYIARELITSSCILPRSEVPGGMHGGKNLRKFLEELVKLLSINLKYFESICIVFLCIVVCSCAEGKKHVNCCIDQVIQQILKNSKSCQKYLKVGSFRQKLTKHIWLENDVTANKKSQLCKSIIAHCFFLILHENTKTKTSAPSQVEYNYYTNLQINDFPFFRHFVKKFIINASAHACLVFCRSGAKDHLIGQP